MMVPEPSEHRVLKILDEYVAALDTGNAPDPKELLALYPDLAHALSSALLGLEFVRRGAKALDGDAEPRAEGQVLGDYRLLREVGRGGMAVVYEAEQVSLGRRVALKVLPFAAVLDPKQLQRFKNEAMAAAHLDHPHIVPVHAVGCERGVHYYAMRYIDGQSLAMAIRDMRGGGAGEGTRTPISSHGSNREPAYIRMAAALGVQAAEALDHAHQLGIVHRDVKPGNLLVDEAGVLRITDFGLARSHNDAGLTVTGELLGTVRYMSPEQALAKRVPVDHRTDVYSLGATLYELFTLEPAFPGDDPHRVIQDIAQRDPAPPRKLNPALAVDLETVLLKAMSKEPTRRYATAQEMADDLRRFLEDKPVLARRPSLATRAAKWSRRHRGAVAAVLTVLFVGALALAAGARREERNTRTALQRAETNLAVARRAVARFLMNAGADLQERPLPPPARRRLLEEALQFYATHGDDEDTFMRPRILLALHRYAEALAILDDVVAARPGDARALMERGYALWHLNRYDDALAAFDRAIVLAPGLAEAHNGRGLVLREMGSLQDALAAHDRALAIGGDDVRFMVGRSNVLSDLGRHADALSTCDRAIALDPNPGPFHMNRGIALKNLGRREDALAAQDRAVATDPSYAAAHYNRGVLLSEMARFAEALAALDRSIELDPVCDQARVARASLLCDLGRHADALAECDRAIGVCPTSVAAHTAHAVALESLGRPADSLAACDRAIGLDAKAPVAHLNRGVALNALKRHAEALAAFDLALKLDPSLARAHAGRGSALLDLGRPEDALTALDRAVELGPNISGIHCNRGAALRALRRHEEALQACRRAIDLAPNDANLFRNESMALVSLGRQDEALRSLGRAIDLAPSLAVAYMDRGVLLEKLGRREEALADFDRVVAIDPGFAWGHVYRGLVFEKRGERGEARTAYAKALDLGMRTQWLLDRMARLVARTPDSAPADKALALELAREAVKRGPKDGAARNTLGFALCRVESWQAAVDAFAEAATLGASSDAYEWFFVAIAYQRLGNGEQARTWFEKAVAWTEANARDDQELRRFRDEAAAALAVR